MEPPIESSEKKKSQKSIPELKETIT